MVPKTFWFYIQFLAFNVNCCIYYNDRTIEKSFVNYMQVQMMFLMLKRSENASKNEKKRRPRGAENPVLGLPRPKSKEVLLVSPNPSQTLARWKRIGSYWNALQTRFMLLLLLMVQDFCQLMTCLVLMRYQIQFVMKILIFIAQRNILIKVMLCSTGKVP